MHCLLRQYLPVQTLWMTQENRAVTIRRIDLMDLFGKIVCYRDGEWCTMLLFESKVE